MATRDPGHDEQDPGRLAPDRPGQRRHPLAATLDERHVAGQEERDVRAQPGGDPQALVGERTASPPAPHASSAPSSAAAASLLPPARPAAIGIRFSRRAARAGVGRAPPTAVRRGGDRPQDEVAGCRPERRPVEVVAGDVEGVLGSGRRGEREAIGQAERGHDRMEGVEAVRPPADDREGQVELGRGEADDRRRGRSADRSRAPALDCSPAARRGCAGRARPSRSARAPRAGAATPPRRASGAAGPDRSRPSASAAAIRAGGTGSCRVRTLWSILRRSRNAAWTSRQSASSSAGSRRSSSANGSTTMTAESTAGAGSKAVGRHPPEDPHRRVVLDEDRQVAEPAGARRDPLGHLALDHQHEPARTGRLAEQPVEDRAGDVVGQVGDDVVRLGQQAGRAAGRARRPR